MVILGSSIANPGKNSVKVKKSSQKILSAICQPTVGQQMADVQT